MEFKLGDFVRFVDERIEGYITRIDGQMIGVTGQDDFEIPVPANRITLVHGHSKNTTAAVPASQPHIFKERGIFLAIASDEKITSTVHFQLINLTSYFLFAVVNTEKDDKEQGVFAQMVNPESAIQVYSASLADLNAWPGLNMQLLYYNAHSHESKQPIIYRHKFNAKDFSHTKKNAPLINQQAWLFELDSKQIHIDTNKLKESLFKPAEERITVAKPETEVDLHIEKLRDDHQFLNSDEILRIQLTEFNKNLDAAIVHKLPFMIFIHGVGNGTLRHQIHKIISKHTGVKTFMDARKEKFGYGATEILLK